jgi:hypothetical protein
MPVRGWTRPEGLDGDGQANPPDHELDWGAVVGEWSSGDHAALVKRVTDHAEVS